MIITKYLSLNTIIPDRINIVSWETDDLDVDLLPLKDKNIATAKGTYNQIMKLYEICKIKLMIIIDPLDADQLKKLDRLRNYKIRVRNIKEVPNKKLRYVEGELNSKTNYQSIINILLSCYNICLCAGYTYWLCDLVCEYGNSIKILRVGSIINSNFKKIIQKLINLKYIIIISIHQSMVDILSRSHIKYINIIYCNGLINITPLLTNPMIEKIKTNIECAYDLRSNITLLEFKTQYIELYTDLIERCNENKQQELLRRMSEIKTPNEV